MKKWKILNDSDKDSNSSKNSKQIKNQNNTSHYEQKIASKPYRPLKRSKGANSFTQMKNLSTDLPVSTLPHKYIRSPEIGHSSSATINIRMKTDSIPEAFDLGMKSLEDIQQIHTSGLHMSERPCSVVLRREKQFNWLSSRQTERFFSKEPSIQSEVKEFIPNQTPFRKKSIPPPKFQSIKLNLKILTNQQQKLKQFINKQIKNFNQLFEKQKTKWNENVQKVQQKQIDKKNEAKDFGQKFIEQYRQYKPRIDELEEQKQVFLQTLIRMTPL